MIVAHQMSQEHPASLLIDDLMEDWRTELLVD
jgi:hypothetical protein